MGANGFTEDARKQELRYAAKKETILLLGPKELEEWIESLTPDDHLEDLIDAAMLR